MFLGKKKLVWLFAIVTSIAIVLAQPVFADNGYILKKGKEYPICREMLEIVNLSQNAHTIGYRTTAKELTIPKKYKNFEMAEWKPISHEEAKKYITPETFHVLELIKKRALTIEKDWDGKGDFEFTTAQIDLDGKDGLETMLRYRLPNWKKWSCMLEETKPTSYYRHYNPQISVNGSIEYGDEHMGQCLVLMYGGKTFHALGYGSGLVLDKVKEYSLGTDNYLYNETLCQIDNPNWKKERTGVIK